MRHRIWLEAKKKFRKSKLVILWSEMTLKYWMMVERYPKLKEEVGGSIPDWEISSLLDSNMALPLSIFCLKIKINNL